jgi:SAM-dependent methyltransferase
VAPTDSLRSFGHVFDQVAEAYDEVRPGYPPELVDLAVARGHLCVGSRVLEVGAGTGKLTESLVERGLIVDALEPGPNMIAAARKRIGDTGSVTFHAGRFEDVDLPERAFDGLFSATAFHWVDPEIGWAKAASRLRAGGLLALLAYIGVSDEESAGVQAELLEALRFRAPEIAGAWKPLRTLHAIESGVAVRSDNASGVWDWLMSDGRHKLAVPAAADLFERVEVASHVRAHEETADEFVAHFRTTSLWFQLDPDQRDALEEDDRRIIERNGGAIRSSFATMLMTATSV